MTEAVDRLCLLQFVLIQALLLTVCSSESDKNYVWCFDINGTVGKPLTLTCEITLEPTCSCYLYKWKKNGTTLKNDTCDCERNLTLSYTIQNPSRKDNGTFTLWVVLRCGIFEGYLRVILSEEVTTAPRENEHFGSDSLRNRHVDVIFVALLTTLALIGLAVFFRKYITMVFQRLFQERLNLDLCKKQNISQGIV